MVTLSCKRVLASADQPGTFVAETVLASTCTCHGATLQARPLRWHLHEDAEVRFVGKLSPVVAALALGLRRARIPSRQN